MAATDGTSGGIADPGDAASARAAQNGGSPRVTPKPFVIFPDLTQATSAPPLPPLLRTLKAVLPLSLLAYGAGFALLKGEEASAVLSSTGVVALAKFLLWPDYGPFAPTAEALGKSWSPWFVTLGCGGLATMMFDEHYHFISRLGRVLAQVGVGLSALPLVKAGLWLAGDEVFTSEADYKLQQDCTLDSVQFRALNGSERGLWPQVTHVIRLACVLDGLLLQCLERRLRGSETSADATAIESHLITRLAQLVVHRQGHRINVTYVTEGGQKGEPGFSMSIRTVREYETGPPTDKPEIEEDGAVRGAVEMWELRQLVLRCLSPATFVCLASSGALFPPTQLSNINATLKCTPAPLPAVSVAAIEAEAGKETAGNTETALKMEGRWLGEDAKRRLEVLPMPLALCFALGGRPDLLTAAVAIGADPTTLAAWSTYQFPKFDSKDTTELEFNRQQVTVELAARSLDRLGSEQERQGSSGVPLQDAIRKGLELRAQLLGGGR